MGTIKLIGIAIAILFIIILTYSIIKAIKTIKRNKAADEATRQMFLAQIENEQNESVLSDSVISDTINIAKTEKIGDKLLSAQNMFLGIQPIENLPLDKSDVTNMNQPVNNELKLKDFFIN